MRIIIIINKEASTTKNSTLFLKPHIFLVIQYFFSIKYGFTEYSILLLLVTQLSIQQNFLLFFPPMFIQSLHFLFVNYESEYLWKLSACSQFYTTYFSFDIIPSKHIEGHYPRLFSFSYVSDFPSGVVIKNPPASAGNTRDAGLISESGRSPWSRKWQLTPVFLLGKFQRQRSLAGNSPQGHKELDTTEQPITHTCNWQLALT